MNPYNAIGQRSNVVNTGTAFSDDAHTVWGLDIAEQAAGLPPGGRPGAMAGGVGCLLGVEEVSGSQAGEYVYFYDLNPVSNGTGGQNVGQVFDWDAGTVAAHYQYDPFGREITATGTYAATNRFRFSTKHLDHETDLYYYGYRYYSPEMGRFLNRDPIEEHGGLNIYVMVANDLQNNIDFLGLSGQEYTGCVKKRMINVKKCSTRCWALGISHGTKAAIIGGTIGAGFGAAIGIGWGIIGGGIITFMCENSCNHEFDKALNDCQNDDEDDVQVCDSSGWI